MIPFDPPRPPNPYLIERPRSYYQVEFTYQSPSDGAIITEHWDWVRWNGAHFILRHCFDLIGPILRPPRRATDKKESVQ